MSIFSAMTSAVSGMAGQSQKIAVTAENTANSGTTAYAKISSSFSSLVSTSSRMSGFSAGGIQTHVRRFIDDPGIPTDTSSGTDLYIDGRGFFPVTKEITPGQGEVYYTRAGSFAFDNQRHLRNAQGYYLQAWRTDEEGIPVSSNTASSNSLEVVNLSNLPAVAKESTQINLAMNLKSGVPIGAEHTVSLRVFDSKGIGHNLLFSFRKTAEDLVDKEVTWQMKIESDDAVSIEQTSVGSGDDYEEFDVSTEIVFDEFGRPKSFAGDDSAGASMPDIAIAWNSAVADSILTLDLGAIGMLNGITSNGNEFIERVKKVDGLEAGNFIDVSINEKGTINAHYDNGQIIPVYQIPLATVPNPNGLDVLTGNTYRLNDVAGELNLAKPGENGTGLVVSNKLQLSSADLADALTEMVVAQRAFSANTKVFSTADEMFDALERIKR